jgi:hypothetical protein
METTFKLDGCHYLIVCGDMPRVASDARSVLLQVNHKPLPNVDGTCPPDDLVVSFTVAPSEARAIASAILSAATEARG